MILWGCKWDVLGSEGVGKSSARTSVRGSGGRSLILALFISRSQRSQDFTGRETEVQ